jgi:dihydrofolate synthase/folylpolyglutamate synthase
VPRPLLTAITPIGIDHIGFLGDTIAKIAVSKAGIIKPEVACVIGPQPAEAVPIIEAAAARNHAPLFRHGREWNATPMPTGLLWESRMQAFRLPRPALRGPHQIVNAGIAIACATQLDGFAIPEAAIAAGLQTVDWPARMQRLGHGPLLDAMPTGTELWLDGAHNAMAGEALAATLRELPPRPTWLIAGVLNTKDAAGLLRPLASLPLMQGACCIAIPGEANSLSAENLAAAAHSAGLQASTAESPSRAAQRIADMIRAGAAIQAAPARVVITGSLYLAGRILAENG